MFFAVNGIDKEKVSVYELATKKIKKNGRYVEIIDNRNPRKKPYFVYKSNCDAKPNYWVQTGIELDEENKNERVIYLYIDYFSKLREDAKEYEQYPSCGVYKAIFIEEEYKKGFGNFYWEMAEKKYKIKKERKSNMTNYVC